MDGFRWRSSLGASVILFLLYGAVNVVAALVVPTTLLRWAFDRTLSKDAPDGRPACAASGQIIVSPEVGGLHHRYDRQAA